MQSNKLLHFNVLCFLLGIAPALVHAQSAGYPDASVRPRQSIDAGTAYPDDASVESRPAECPPGTPTADCLSWENRNPGALAPLTLSGPRSAAQANREKREMPGQQQMGPQVPEQHSEFQRFVESSTGHLLPIYGASLFDRVPTTFSPVDRVPITPGYVIGPGDEIEIRVWGQVNLNERVTVDRTGEIFLPRTGGITVAGLKFDELHAAIQSSLNRVFRNFDLDVNMGQLRSIQIFVVGQARRPGSYTVSSLSTLVNALFASGGPSTRGSLRGIQLQRAGKVVTSFDLYQLLLQGDMTKDASLMPGDVIFIPDAGPRVAVDGSVATPAIYELKGDASLKDVLGFAGGLSQTAAGARAIVERFDNRSTLHSENVELTSGGMEMHPKDGDIVRILPVVPRFDRTVTLRGNVADPVRFPWHAGMKVSDLIPSTDALLTRGFWVARNGLLKAPKGQPAFTEERSQANFDSSLAAAVVHDTSVTREFARQTDVQPLAPNIDWNYATIERIDPKDQTTQLLSFNLKGAVIDRDASSDLALAPNDIVTIYSDADISVPHAQQTRYVRIEGEVVTAGVYAAGPGETLQDIVARAGGLTPNAYLFGAQFTRVSTRKEQQRRFADFVGGLERDLVQKTAMPTTFTANPARAVSDDAMLASERTMIERLRNTPVTGRIVLDLQPGSQSTATLPRLALENGDTFLVPSAPETVNVFGMVYNQGSVIYGDKLRLGDYLAQTGGPTRYADRAHMFVIRADGSVVSKESRSRFLANDFELLPMHPGDTIVVPMYLKKSTLLNDLVGWSQVLGNIGISAAAVNVLR